MYEIKNENRIHVASTHIFLKITFESFFVISVDVSILSGSFDSLLTNAAT